MDAPQIFDVDADEIIVRRGNSRTVACKSPARCPRRHRQHKTIYRHRTLRYMAWYAPEIKRYVENKPPDLERLAQW